MTSRQLNKIDGSDLYALPDDQAELAYLAGFAHRCLGHPTGITPRNVPERVNLWRVLNSEFAVLNALGAPGDDALAKLETKLGIEGTALAENPDPADVARVANFVRSKARAQCDALLADGYTP